MEWDKPGMKDEVNSYGDDTLHGQLVSVSKTIPNQKQNWRVSSKRWSNCFGVAEVGRS
jgi:hypothetical protein